MTVGTVCRNCGKEIGTDERYCPFCGAEQTVRRREKYCSKCGHKLLDGEQFCPFCGTDQKAAEYPVQNIRNRKEQTAGGYRPENDPHNHSRSHTAGIAVIIIAGLLLFGTGLFYLFSSKAQSLIGNILSLDFFGLTEPAESPEAAEFHDDAVSVGKDPGMQEQAIYSADMPGESENEFKNAYEYYSERSEEYPDYSAIHTVCINGNQILLNETVPGNHSIREGNADLEQLSVFPNLKNLYISNTSVSFPREIQPALTVLEVLNCNVGYSASGIENYQNLETLSITESGLESLENIAGLTHLTELNASDNHIANIDMLAECTALKKAVLYGNQIRDYHGLKNVRTVDIWNDRINSVGSSQKDPYAKQVHVIVSELRIRTSPTADSKVNILNEFAVEGYYYYILDEYWDPGLEAVWYKIGNEMWIAGGDHGKEYTEIT